MTPADAQNSLRQHRSEALRQAVAEARRQLAEAEASGDEETMAATLHLVEWTSRTAHEDWAALGRRLPDDDLVSKELRDVFRDSVKVWRTAAQCTQADLADAMTRLGFVTWKRITVAEAESGKRKLSIEEMVGIAALFGRSVASMCGTVAPLVLNERRSISAEQLKLMLGGDPEEVERVSAEVALVTSPGSPDDWRPATEWVAGHWRELEVKEEQG